MTAAEWDDLARLAEAATPGPWQRSGTYVETVPEFDLHRFDTMGVDVAKAHLTNADAEFIAAANPATILRLIADLREAQMERADLLIERDALAARLAAVEALADQWDEKAAVLSRQSESRAGLSDAEMLAAVSEFYAARSANLRAVLSAAPTTTPDLETP